MKPVVLTFARYYLPGFLAGGPIRSLANMVDRLGDELEFRVVALNTDLGADGPYPNVPLDTWSRHGKAFVRYVTQGSFGMSAVANIANSTPHDLIYLNSFFDPRFTQQVIVNNLLGRLGKRPIILAPRGELSEGALHLKRLRKRCFISVAKWIGLYEGLIWQASSAFEAEDIRRTVVGKGPDTIFVAENLIEQVDAPILKHYTEAGPPIAGRREGHILRVCFLSRISPMKNLDYALRVMAKVTVPARFGIYGPIEDHDFWANCKELIARLPPHVQAVHEGPIQPANVVEALAQNDVFLFPTRGENFGHVILEALRAGLPVLLSDQTPWRRLAEAGVGWDLPLHNIVEFVTQLEEVAKWSDVERERQAMRSRTFAHQLSAGSHQVEAHRRLFFDAMAIGEPSR